MPSDTRGTRPRTDSEWWHNAVVYQIYPRSFADGNGDGIGDLLGVLTRLHYLADLGIDAIWLSPFYPSPLADGGYDITDHRDVDPRLGTLADFDAVVRLAHHLGIKVIIDVVPNHTSIEHSWFRAALRAGTDSPERDRYIFRDGAPDGPPSDWLSHFGGSAWEHIDDEQWYLHLFAREQPDLNWANPEIRQYFLDTLRFWADRGVDGFRIDVAHSLAKDASSPLRSQPHLDQQLPPDGTDPLYDRDEVHEIYREWRKLFDTYRPPKMAIAETWHPTSSRTYLYARPDELGQVFDFSLLKSAWSRDEFHDVIRRSIADHAGIGGGLTWVLSSHDVPRHPSRFALPAGADLDTWLLSNGADPVVDPAVARRRGRAATLMMLALPGSSYLYQGEELGLLEVADLPTEALQDPVWERTGHQLKGRDGCRVPLPWNTHGTSYGFGANGAWLPQPSWFSELAASQQEHDAASTLSMYKAALAVRRTLTTNDDDLTWHNEFGPEVLHFSRTSGWECIVNFGRLSVRLPDADILLTSESLEHPAVLPTDTTAWLLRPDSANPPGSR